MEDFDPDMLKDEEENAILVEDDTALSIDFLRNELPLTLAFILLAIGFLINDRLFISGGALLIVKEGLHIIQQES